MSQTTPVYEASYTGNTPIADIIKTDIPPEPPSNQWVKASMTVKNVGTTPGRIYAYVANHEWSDEEFSLRAAGGEWVLRPGEPGIAIVTAYDVQPGEQVVFDLEFFFPKAGTYWIKLEAGHVEDPYLIKDDERTTWIEASGALWVKLTPDKTRGTPPLTVHFDVDFGGGVLPITFTIDYGDGSPPDTWVWTGSGAIPGFVHTYDYPGEYEVTLTAVDASGVTKQDKATIIIEPPATPYTLFVSVGTGGAVNLYINDVLYDVIRGSKSFTIYEGTEVTLKAVPDDGYEFDYWLVDGEKRTDNPISFTMTRNVNVSAYFKEKPEEKLQVTLTPSVTEGQAPLTVTFNVSWSGGMAPYYVVIDYGDGSKPEEKITWSTSYTFTHTYQAPGTYQVKVDVEDFLGVPGHAETTINVYQQPPPPPPPPEKVTLTIVGAKGGTIYYGTDQIREGQTKTYSLDVGSAVTISQQPDPGYQFKQWTYDGKTSTSETLTLTIQRDTTVTAVFEPTGPPEIPWATIATIAGIGVGGATAAYLVYRYAKKKEAKKGVT